MPSTSSSHWNTKPNDCAGIYLFIYLGLDCRLWHETLELHAWFSWLNRTRLGSCDHQLLFRFISPLQKYNQAHQDKAQDTSSCRSTPELPPVHPIAPPANTTAAPKRAVSSGNALNVHKSPKWKPPPMPSSKQSEAAARLSRGSSSLPSYNNNRVNKVPEHIHSTKVASRVQVLSPECITWMYAYAGLSLRYMFHRWTSWNQSMCWTSARLRRFQRTRLSYVNS